MALEKNLFCLVPIALVIEVWSRWVGVVVLSRRVGVVQEGGCGPGGWVLSRCVGVVQVGVCAYINYGDDSTL